MNKRILVFCSLLLALTIISCNKEKSYTVKLQNSSSGSVRVTVKLDPAYGAPGQNLLKLDKSVLPGQYVEVYYNKGVGIDLPTVEDNDTLLQYEVDVMNADSIYSTVNFRSLNKYVKKGDKHNAVYEGIIIDEVFPD